MEKCSVHNILFNFKDLFQLVAVFVAAVYSHLSFLRFSSVFPEFDNSRLKTVPLFCDWCIYREREGEQRSVFPLLNCTSAQKYKKSGDTLFSLLGNHSALCYSNRLPCLSILWVGVIQCNSLCTNQPDPSVLYLQINRHKKSNMIFWDRLCLMSQATFVFLQTEHH